MALLKRLRKSRDWLYALCAELFREHGIAVPSEGASRCGRSTPQRCRSLAGPDRSAYSPERFPAAEISDWYRLRWQVEVVFKRFESLVQLGQLPKSDDESSKA